MQTSISRITKRNFMKIVLLMFLVFSFSSLAKTSRALMQFDEISNGLSTISLEHLKIHDKKHYTCIDYDNDVDSTEQKIWRISTSNSNVHFIFDNRLSNVGTVELREDAVFSSNGNNISCVNNYRGFPNQTNLLFYEDAVLSSNGNRLLFEILGTNTASPVGDAGGITQRENEFVLRKNSEYTIKVTPFNNDTQVSIIT